MAPRETENDAYAKFRGDKQRALWFVMVFSGVVNCFLQLPLSSFCFVLLEFKFYIIYGISIFLFLHVFMYWTIIANRGAQIHIYIVLKVIFHISTTAYPSMFFRRL